MSLSKTHLSLLSTGSTQEDPSPHNWKSVDWDVNNQINQNKPLGSIPCRILVAMATKMKWLKNILVKIYYAGYIMSLTGELHAYILMIAIYNWHLASKNWHGAFKHWKLRWDCMYISSDLSLFTSVISLFSASSIFSKYARYKKTWLCYMQTTKVRTILHIQRLCYSLCGKLNGQSCSMHNFNILTTLCRWAGWFEHYRVRNTEDRFSRVEAQLFSVIHVYKSFRLVWTLFDRAYIVTD